MSKQSRAVLSHPRQLLSAFGLRAKEGIGQNFLVSDRALDRIVTLAGVDSGDVVLEIGTGLGRLTERLARRAGRVVSVEIDAGLARAAGGRLAGFENVCLLCCDFLQGKHRINATVTGAVQQALGGAVGSFKVVSNLPYCISSPALVCLLEWEVPPRAVYVMVQSEVAERLIAPPGSREYGPLTVFVQYRADVERLFTLPPGAFWPPPKVSSSFIRLVPSAPHPVAADYELFREVVNVLFQNRRKTLRHALHIGWADATAHRILQGTNLPQQVRPEELAVEDFVSIANLLADRQQ